MIRRECWWGESQNEVVKKESQRKPANTSGREREREKSMWVWRRAGARRGRQQHKYLCPIRIINCLQHSKRLSRAAASAFPSFGITSFKCHHRFYNSVFNCLFFKPGITDYSVDFRRKSATGDIPPTGTDLRWNYDPAYFLHTLRWWKYFQ